MAEKTKLYDFFLGANSGDGFVSFFEELGEMALDGRRSYYIKGGPGTGKSTFLRKVAAIGELYEDTMELIHCSSDPNSLDAVILPKVKVALADTTPPHVLESRYPGAFERVLPFTAAFDDDGLEADRAELFYATQANQSCQKQCGRLLAAAKSLLADNYLSALAATDAEKVMRTAYRVFLREGKRLPGGKGVEHERMLSAVTPEGVVFYRSTVTENFDKIYCLMDPYGASANIFLTAMRDLLLSKGTEIYTCRCPIDPREKIDHILAPELGLAFTTVNSYLQLPKGAVTKNLHFNRFTNMALLENKKQRLRFNRRLADEILKEASAVLRKAKFHHDEMEAVYKRHVNFAFIDELYQKTAAEIVKRYENQG